MPLQFVTNEWPICILPRTDKKQVPQGNSATVDHYDKSMDQCIVNQVSLKNYVNFFTDRSSDMAT